MRNAAILLATLAVVACGESVTEPDPFASASFQIVEGAEQVDTIEARLDPITVELTTGGVEATALPGVVINFVVTEPGCGEPFAGSAITDASGRATELWDLGDVAKDCTMEARAVDADGTPRVYASARATVRPGVATVLTFHDDPVTTFVGTPLDLASVLDVFDRAGNVSSATIAWTAGNVSADNGIVDEADEADGWVVADAGSIRDSTGVWVLDDLGALGTAWSVEHWTRFGAASEREHPDCPATGFDATAVLDSIYSTVTYTGTDYRRSDHVLRLGQLGDFVDAISTTFYCRNGNVVRFPEDSGFWITPISDTPLANEMRHRPHALDGSVGVDGEARAFAADGPAGHYVWTHGSLTVTPYRADSTRLAPAG